MINEQLLLKKLRSSTSVQPLLQSSRLAQIKLAKIVYNNRSIRQITKFINQADAILRKSKQEQNQKRVRTQNNQNKGRYDQDQLKQLTYQFQSMRQKYLHTINQGSIDYGINTTTNGIRRRQTLRGRPKQLNKNTLKRKQTLLAHHSALPFQNRFNTGRNVFNSLKKQFSMDANEIVSPTRLKRRLTGIMDNYHQQVKISLKQQQIQNGINNLIKLINTKQAYDYNIDNDVIFKMIVQKYMHKQKNQLNQQPLQKMLKISQPHKPLSEKLQFQLPYCQFAGLKGCRKSIDRIFNMPLKGAQRIAFKVYDRNGNGVIDEKDIIQLFTQAQRLQSIQQDLQIIIKNYKVVSQNPSSPRGRRQTLNSKKTNDQSQYSISKLNKIQVIEQKPADTETKKFRKSAFFTFKQTKQQFFKKKQSSIAQISLSWEDFQVAFKNTRPKVFYDMLDYLFNIKSQQIYDRSLKHIQQNRNSFKSLILYNNDGKSQAASNFNAQMQAQSNEKAIRRKTTQYSKLSLRSKTTSKKNKQNSLLISKFKIRQQKQMNSQTIQDLITKVKSIQQFQSVQY